MCDLWKNTTDVPVAIGDIPGQIEYALDRLPSTKHLKLYNSGNFFDPKAIPRADYQAIIQRLNHFDTVLIENHPKLINKSVIEFQEKLPGDLQVALGLETIHPEVLPRLNKQMTLEDFSSSVRFLNRYNIKTRAFILLRPPFLNEKEGIIWAKKSIDFAFDSGVECCVVIPTRSGNGAMNQLENSGYFHPPAIESLEEVLDYGISIERGRVFADLWDLEHFSTCNACYRQRQARLENENHAQSILPRIVCHCK